MHELGIARDICEAATAESGGRPLKSMTVAVGALAGVSTDALDFCMTEIARETGLGSPAITIESAPARFKCSCGTEYEVSDITQGCPSCGDYSRELISGMDVIIKEITYEGGSDDHKAKKRSG